MNVCIATSEYIPKAGGIATFYHGLATLLARYGHKVLVLSVGETAVSHDSGIQVVWLDEQARRAERMLSPRLRGQAPSVVRHMAIGIAMRDWMEGNAEQWAFDVVETAEFGGSSMFLTDLSFPPLAVTCHGSYGQLRIYQDGGKSSAKYRVLVGMEAMLLGLADVVIAHSPANAKAWKDCLGREVHFVPAPWAGDVHADIPSEWIRTKNDVVEGVVVGRLQNVKGPVDLIEALHECKRRGVPVKITWIGRDTATAPDGGSMLGYIQERFPELWGTSFKWIERLSREETRHIQAVADFAVVPSRWETLNLTAVEAMSVETPLIISSGAGASYLVQDGETGMVTPPGDAMAIADAIERMAADEPLRRRLGRAGREAVWREFDPGRVVAARIEAYEAAVQQRAVRRKQPFLDPASGFVAELLGMERAHTRPGLLGRFRGSAHVVKKQLRHLWATLQG